MIFGKPACKDEMKTSESVKPNETRGMLTRKDGKGEIGRMKDDYDAEDTEDA